MRSICPSKDVATALGHTDGGELVRKLYGHRDHERALDRVTAAYGRTASHTQGELCHPRVWIGCSNDLCIQSFTSRGYLRP